MKNKYTFDWLIPNLNNAKCTSQIVDFIIQAISSKELMAGDLIPPYRALAKINKVSESSVRRAYTKLIDTNWLTSAKGSGTSVSLTNPSEDLTPRTSGFTERFSAGMAIKNKDAQSEKKVDQPFSGVGTDFPSPASFPEEKFSEYYTRFRTASKALSQAELLMEYEALYLKDAIVQNLNRKRGFGLKHNMLEIVHSRKSSLNRVFKVLLNPGDVVINTSPHDIKLAAALEKHGARVYTLNRKDPDFIDRFDQILQYTAVRAIHIRPQCSFPESYALSEADCNRLIELAKYHRVCIIEEEDDHEFWYGNEPYRSLARYNHGGFVIYMGALSKATPDTTALRLVVASSQFMTEFLALPRQSIESRDIIKEKAIAEMIKNGDMAEYAREIRLKSRAYRDQLHLILSNHLHKYISYEIPQNGLTFWLKFDDNIDLNVVLNKLDMMGITVPYHPNNHKTKDKVNHMMLGFGAFDIHEAEGGASMLGQIISGLHPK
ncbi:MAG: PLP-dependent aminotransferase family protein [Candidatus Pedobacter colombiensis]|uniref:PLP-dependent aminotransferase family protein n=1 Tax=Candidatus Pedobacter colombiensis TaxID=3121371 RepID=A0AAJ5WCB0_9SPHI|nr:PLP-dependent aminotransferase family protein [Pedobacter sp.]WEK20849.1 MAG: PLP-dependent aminotransferase family protein [Pedobacter sp.]